MHDTAAAIGAAFFRCYADAIEGVRILEVGAGDVNGTLRGCAPHHAKYTGMDLAAGPGVDIVLSDPYTYPFEPASYDIIVSSSCFEHDQMFWLSFAEMCRVLRKGGFIYLNVPSNGTFHRYPTDNWRFYPDSGLALAAWGRRNGHDIHLIESLIGRRRRDIWNDCVMVFGKGEAPRPLSSLAEIFPRSLNIRVGERETFTNYCEQTEDMTLRAWLTEKLRSLPSPDAGDDQTSPFEALITSLAEREVALDGTERAAAERSAAAAAQIDALRGELAERDARLVRAEAETSDLRSALGSAEQAAAERDARLVRAEAETSDLRSALGSAEQAAAERAAAAEAQIDALRGELAECSARLVRAEAGAADLQSAVAAGRAELEGALRCAAAEKADRAEALKRAEADLRTGLEERAAALQRAGRQIGERDAVIAALQDELAAARQVGGFLLGALKTGPALALAADRPGRQPWGMFRLIRYWSDGARRGARV